MTVGPKTVTKYELRSNWLDELAETQGYTSMTDYYTSLLTSGAKLAQEQYQAEADIARTQTSYDISGAYANYLKQQRQLANQQGLEAGYKEEVGKALTSDISSVYKQTQATEAQALTSAAESAAKTYSEQKSAADQILKQYQKQAETMANLYKYVETSAGYETSQFPFYTTTKEGLELTPWGKTQISKLLLEDADAFAQSLEAAGMEDELAYYMSNPQQVREQLFGITGNLYDETSQETMKSKISTPGYIESLEKPTIDFNWNDYAGLDFGKSGKDKVKESISSVKNYAKDLGLSDEDIVSALGKNIDDAINDITKKADKDERVGKYVRQDVLKAFDETLIILENAARKKYKE